ncbi:MAG: mandelate racemase/muconate lactonizing enzyme family protein [Pirellulales bacterium]|nr:mandelate racemase/muconate lactonizing enzyme family protein [Pirellulales bacterium]
MRITRVDTFLVELPQRYPIAPYQSRYRPQSSTQSLLVRLAADSGLVGWGEAPQRYLGEQLTGQEATRLKPVLVGQTVRDDLPHSIAIADERDLYLQSAVEMACWDLLGRARGQPLYAMLGKLLRPEVELAACMGIRPPAQAAAIAGYYVEQGFSTLKTKAGRSPEEDLAMARAIRDAVGHRLKLRMDPNMGYGPEVCLQLARDLEPYELEYFEQPMPAELLQESARIRRQTRTPLALNESVTTLDVVQEILRLEAAAYLLPDTYQCGGIWACREVARLAQAAGVPCVMHCAHDLGPKTAAMLHLAASVENFSLANDCTYYGLQDDVLAQPFEIRGGRMRVPHAAGLGIEVSMEKVARYTLASSCAAGGMT